MVTESPSMTRKTANKARRRVQTGTLTSRARYATSVSRTSQDATMWKAKKPKHGQANGEVADMDFGHGRSSNTNQLKRDGLRAVRARMPARLRNECGGIQCEARRLGLRGARGRATHTLSSSSHLRRDPVRVQTTRGRLTHRGSSAIALKREGTCNDIVTFAVSRCGGCYWPRARWSSMATD